MFLCSLLTGFVVTLGCVKINQLRKIAKVIHPLDGNQVYLTDQLKESDFGLIQQLNIETIVDLRPDNEQQSQLSSANVQSISEANGMKFNYIPVPHGDIPSSQVDKLASVLNSGKRPILLYCRTGKRALRTYCLAEATIKGGPDQQQIMTIAVKAGFGIDDLLGDVQRRIAARRTK